MTKDATLTMGSREIAELTSSRHDNVKRTIETLSSRGVITLPQIEEVSNTGLGPKTIRVYQLDKRSSLIVVAQVCPEFTAKIIDRWQELEEGAVGVAPAGRVLSPMAQAAEFAGVMADSLRLEGSARLGLARSVTAIVAPHLLPALPAYAVDAPAGSTTGSSEPTAAISTLLKQKGLRISAIKANRALHDLGLIEQLHRPSSSGAEKSFWSVTQAGLHYGKNVTNDKNQNETQPHWFVSRADEIIELIQTND